MLEVRVVLVSCWCSKQRGPSQQHSYLIPVSQRHLAESGNEFDCSQKAVLVLWWPSYISLLSNYFSQLWPKFLVVNPLILKAQGTYIPTENAEISQFLLVFLILFSTVAKWKTFCCGAADLCFAFCPASVQGAPKRWQAWWWSQQAFVLENWNSSKSVDSVLKNKPWEGKINTC